MENIPSQQYSILKVAKEFNIGIGTISDHLRENGFNIEPKPNSRLTENQYQIVKSQFFKSEGLLQGSKITLSKEFGNIQKVIAKKNRPVHTNHNIGFITPIFKFNSDNKQYFKVKEKEFPNTGEIFIVGGYNYIDTICGYNELFEIEDIIASQDKYEQDKAGSCLYSTNSSSIRKLPKWCYIPIFYKKFNLEEKTVKELNGISDGWPFFLEDDNFIYGPFNLDVVTLTSVDIQYFENKDYNNPVEDLMSDYKDCIFKFDKTKIVEKRNEDYLIDLTDLLKNSVKEVIYFGSKEKILDWGRNLLNSKLDENSKAALSRIKDIELPNLSSEIEIKKLELLKKYLNEANSWLNEEVPKYFQSYLESPEGNNKFEKYLADNEERFFNQYRSDRINTLEKQIGEKEEYLISLEQEVSILNNQENFSDKIFDDINTEDRNLIRAIISDKNQRETLLEFFQTNKELNNLKNELISLGGKKELLESQYNEQQKHFENLKEAIFKIKQEFLKESDFAKKVIDAKIYSDLINNIDPSNSEDFKGNEKAVIANKLNLNNTEYTSTKHFIDDLLIRLKKINRNISYNEMVNYLVLINQNFITIIAGLPGVGKTSLVEKLANSLGLIANKRYLKIPVAKGWTSSKDLIGYFNPLTKSYQRSKTGLHEFLKICEYDCQNASETPSIVLLDEANLSPIEHYWSDFLALTDFDYKRLIRTTDKEDISFGSGLRFLATINYDHTTEVLSDRILSRAPVIRLNVSEYSTEENSNINFEHQEIFTLEQISKYLTKDPQKEYFKGDIKNKFENIVKVLQDEESGFGQPIIIGMRKYKAVEKYCNVAGSLMDDSLNKFISLDYAVNQYILPLINGRGDGYYKRLLELNNTLQSLPISQKQLNRIILMGNENHKYYKFFS